jgi:uncharacterized protein YoxC
MIQAILNIAIAIVIGLLVFIVIVTDNIHSTKIDEMNKQLQVINQLLFSDNI